LKSASVYKRFTKHRYQYSQWSLKACVSVSSSVSVFLVSA